MLLEQEREREREVVKRETLGALYITGWAKKGNERNIDDQRDNALKRKMGDVESP